MQGSSLVPALCAAAALASAVVLAFLWALLEPARHNIPAGRRSYRRTYEQAGLFCSA